MSNCHRLLFPFFLATFLMTHSFGAVDVERYTREMLERKTRQYDYTRPVTESELRDIRFIVLTLSNQPLLKLKKYKKELENAGDRINNVHPLLFWYTIFSDRELIAGIHNVKNRDRVWKSFVKGTTEGFDDALAVGQMQPNFINDFCTRLNLPLNAIATPLNNQEWGTFVKQLLILIPREGNPDRYNM